MQLQIQENNKLAQIQKEPSINSREREGYLVLSHERQISLPGGQVNNTRIFFQMK